MYPFALNHLKICQW